MEIVNQDNRSQTDCVINHFHIILMKKLLLSLDDKFTLKHFNYLKEVNINILKFV